MSSEEYQDLKGRMDRIERLLARLVGDEAAVPSPAPVPVSLSAPELADNNPKALQERGHHILDTQGIEAYHKFWKEQLRKCRKPRQRAKAA